MKSTSDVMLRVANLQDAKRYYNEVLGFPIVTDTERANAATQMARCSSLKSNRFGLLFNVTQSYGGR